MRGFPHVLTASGSLIIVVAVAIAMLGCGSAARSNPRVRSVFAWKRPCLPVHIPRCLVEQYGVFARPQTVKEKAVVLDVRKSLFFAGQALHDARIKLVADLTRIVPIDRSNRVVLFVVRASLGPPDFYLGGALMVNGKGKYFDAGWPFIPGAMSPHPLSKWLLFPSYTYRIAGYQVSIVPDHVARIRWTFAHPPVNGRPTIDVRVRDDVVFARMAHGYGSPTTTEYGPDGRILARTDSLTPITQIASR